MAQDRDLFAEAGIRPKHLQQVEQVEPRDLFAEAGVKPKPSDMSIWEQIKHVNDWPQSAIKPDLSPEGTKKRLQEMYEMWGGPSAPARLAIPAAKVAGKLAGEAIDYVRPGKYSKELMHELGQGATTTEENAKAFAEHVKDVHDTNLEQFKAVREPLLAKYGDQPVVSPAKLARLANRPFAKSQLLDTDIKDLLRDFVKSGKFRDADELRKELGARLGYFKRQSSLGTLPSKDIPKVQYYKKLRDSLVSGMDNFMAKQNPTDVQLFKQSNRMYENKVIPFYSSKKLTQIAKGTKRNPKEIASIFKSPEEQIKAVSREIGTEGKNRVMYDKLLREGERPEELAGTLVEAKKTGGLGHYYSPKLEKAAKAISHRTLVQGLLGTGLGGLAGTMVGMPMAGATIGAAMTAGKPYLNSLMRYFRNRSINQGLKK